MDRMNTINVSNSILDTGNTSIAIGGGLIGAIFISGLYLLFAKTGTIIVLIVMAIFGLIMLFDITISDMIEKIKSFVKRNKALSDEEEQEESKEVDAEEEINIPKKITKIIKNIKIICSFFIIYH